MITTSGALAASRCSFHAIDATRLHLTMKWVVFFSISDAPRRCIYFFAELIKLGVALAWCFKAYRENDQNVVKHFSVDRSDILQYAVPGFVFFAQNNLSFLALQHMNSSAFQLLMNTRIVSVAILAVVMLGKRMHALEWTSIVLLMVGAMQYQLSGCGDDGYKIDTMGLCVMAVIVACAAGGNVYTQKVMQRKMDQPLMVQNAMLYVWGVIFNGTNWILSAMPSADHHGAPPELFGDVGGVQVFSMVFYAIYGLSISIILKRFGAITRTFINTAACTRVSLSRHRGPGFGPNSDTISERYNRPYPESSASLRPRHTSN